MDTKTKATLNKIRADQERIQRRIKDLDDFDLGQLRPLPGKTELNRVACEPLFRSIGDTLKIAFPDWARFCRYEPATALYVSESTPVPFIGGPKPIPYAELQPVIETRFARCRELLELAVKELDDEAAYLTSLLAGEATDNNPSGAGTAGARMKVFIVHGHDHKARGDVALFLAGIELQHIILDNEASQGLTIIEQFERHADQARFAVVILTPDDIGGAAATRETAARARQNVIFELGYFVGKIGRGRVCLLCKGAVEMPSDLHGVIYKRMDDGGGWRHELMKELIAAKMPLNPYAI